MTVHRWTEPSSQRKMKKHRLLAFILLVFIAETSEALVNVQQIGNPNFCQRLPVHHIITSSSRYGPVLVTRRRSAIYASKSATSDNLEISIPTSSDAIYKEHKLEKVPSTTPDALKRFFFGPDVGPILVVTSIFSLVSIRLNMGPIMIDDILLFVLAVIFWSFQEHIMHDKLLHSNFDWYGKSIHKEHHDKPYFHISIDPPELLLGWLGSVFLLLCAFLPKISLALSCTIGYSCAGLFYEWCHYFVHTRVRPRSSFFKRVREHHIKHHMVDSQYWFGFSIPAIDDLFGTNPPVLSRNKAV